MRHIYPYILVASDQLFNLHEGLNGVTAGISDWTKVGQIKDFSDFISAKCTEKVPHFPYVGPNMKLLIRSENNGDRTTRTSYKY